MPPFKQNFENVASNILRSDCVRLSPMPINQLKHDLAKNLSILMERSADLRSQNALAKRSKVAQTTIGNYLNPESYVGAPSLDKIAKLAITLGVEPWQLIHPGLGDQEITRKEIELYRRLQKALKQG
jgi:transcriptional regulator with XRE-family HTH domain